MQHRTIAVSLMAVTLCLGAALPALAQQPSGTQPPIDHIIVIYLENESFDHLYGLFPGAEGIAEAAPALPQVGDDGTPLPQLPSANAPATKAGTPAVAVPALPNAPFDLAAYAPVDQPTPEPIAKSNGLFFFYEEQQSIDSGRMDRFVSTAATPLTMGYYDGSQLPMWQYAQQFTLADHFFHAAFGGTMLNHFWLVCACMPVWPDAPPQIVAQLNPDGTVAADGWVSPDGYVINNLGKYSKQLPPQTAPHIGDRLDAAGVTWAWYTGGWNSGTNPPAFPTLPYFADMAPGTPGYSLHLKDQTDFLAALQSGSLPSVAFVKPDPNEHPDSGASLEEEDQRVADLVKAVQDSPDWPSSAVIVTYDENGGWWDHVAPPQVDRWGPGTRVPAIIISPYAKKGFVDHTVYDTTSILRFIEWRWNLPPLSTRDAQANNLLNAFAFSQ